MNRKYVSVCQNEVQYQDTAGTKLSAQMHRVPETGDSAKKQIEYLYAQPFQYGFAVVKTENGYGLIDSTNTFIVEATKDSLDLAYVEGFSKDTMLINNFESTLMINKEGMTFEVIAKKGN
jgi:hypothetical protein